MAVSRRAPQAMGTYSPDPNSNLNPVQGCCHLMGKLQAQFPSPWLAAHISAHPFALFTIIPRKRCSPKHSLLSCLALLSLLSFAHFPTHAHKKAQIIIPPFSMRMLNEKKKAAAHAGSALHSELSTTLKEGNSFSGTGSSSMATASFSGQAPRPCQLRPRAVPVKTPRNCTGCQYLGLIRV